MRQNTVNKQTIDQNTDSRNRMNRSSYIRGNAVRDIDVRTAIMERPNHQTLHELREENKRRNRFSLGYILFLSAALTVTGFMLITYLQQQANLAATVENISVYEKQLNNLTLANDDEYSKMVNAIDLNEIRRIAVEDLGMVYAADGQKITYEAQNSDYVRQVAGLPD